jgi:DNA recombination protein RmuC
MGRIALEIDIVLLMTALTLGTVLVTFFASRRKEPAESDPRISALEQGLERLEKATRDEMSASRQEISNRFSELRTELFNNISRLSDTLLQHNRSVAEMQKGQLDSFAQTIRESTTANETRHEQLRQSVEKKLSEIQAANDMKLEEMRRTVDEKLQGTLERRLGESFKLVSDRLEQVQKGLGEMQTLATGVGDLKRVLTNVKARGTWGEIQIGNLIEDMLTPDQYGRNVKIRPRSLESVEFAIKLPGKEEHDSQVWLPIDAKFPREDYERLVLAQEQSDATAAEEASRQLEVQLKKCARDIKEKYIHPPHSTDFGILFLPVESLFAEVLRRPGLANSLQQEFRVTVAGPTTLCALLNSLQMGFRTMAVQKRSSEVWKILGAVKSEFVKFGEILDRVGKQLQTAQNTIGSATSKTRNIQSKLRSVELLPPEDVIMLLGEGPATDQESIEGQSNHETGEVD